MGTAENKKNISAWKRIPEILYEATLSKLVKPGSWDFSGYDLLNEDVRADLAENKATLGKEGIKKLVSCSGYEPTAFYLLARGIEDKNLKREIIQQAVVAEARPQSYLESLRDIVSANAALLNEQRVLAGKVYQVSRMGPSLWRERFAEMMDVVTEDHAGKEVFVLAHASLIGLQSFSKFSRLTERPVHLLIGKWFQDQDDPDSGLTINAAKGEVDLLKKGFKKPDPNNFVTIDDTVNTWGHFRTAWAYLMEKDPNRIAIDPSRALVVDKTAGDSSAQAPITN